MTTIQLDSAEKFINFYKSHSSERLILASEKLLWTSANPKATTFVKDVLSRITQTFGDTLKSCKLMKDCKGSSGCEAICSKNMGSFNLLINATVAPEVPLLKVDLYTDAPDNLKHDSISFLTVNPRSLPFSTLILLKTDSHNFRSVQKIYNSQKPDQLSLQELGNSLKLNTIFHNEFLFGSFAPKKLEPVFKELDKYSEKSKNNITTPPDEVLKLMNTHVRQIESTRRETINLFDKWISNFAKKLDPNWVPESSKPKKPSHTNAYTVGAILAGVGAIGGLALFAKNKSEQKKPEQTNDLKPNRPSARQL